MNNIDRINRLKKRIRRTLFIDRLTVFTAGLIATVSAMILMSLVLTLLAGAVILPVWIKIGLLFLSGICALSIFIYLAFSRLFSGNAESTALKLEKKFPDLKGRLIAALQFQKIDNPDRIGYSSDLVAATLVQADEKSTGMNFNEALTAYPILRNLKSFAVLSLVAVLLLVIFPGLFSYSYNVYSNPTEIIAPPLGYRIVNFPGSATAIKYRDIDLGGIISGDRFPDKATVFFRFAGGSWQTSEIDLSTQPRYTGSFGDSLMFYTTIRQVRRSVDYYVKSGRITTETAHIDVVDRPRVTGIKLSLFYPEYTGLEPAVIDENDGNISAVFGTRVNMSIETNVPVEKAEMIFADSSRLGFELSGQSAELTMKIEKDNSYYIRLLDAQGEINPDPIEYYITAVADEYPVIDVIRPGMDINLNDDMTVPLLLGISDDYGFSSLVLKYRLYHDGQKGSENVAVLHFSDRIKTEGEVKFNWDVDPLGMMPSDYIAYQFDLADNDRISGPKVTTSRTYIARLPSLEEIIAQTEAEQSDVIEDAESFLKTHKELSERLNKAAREFDEERHKGERNLSWQNQKELENIAETEEQISQQLKETAKALDETIKKMEKESLAGTEIMEKLQEIQKLFEEVATPEMKEARLKMMEALKNMNPKEIEEALKDFQLSQQELMNRLDRTIALLRKMQIEQKVNAMTELARELAEKQDRMNHETDNSSTDKLPSLAPEEDKLKKDLDVLKQQADFLRQMLDETPYAKAQEADQFCKAVEESDAGGNMQKMSNELSNRNKSEASEEGKKALTKLLAMFNTMQQGQASMCKGGGEEAARKMREAIDDIYYLSDEQEGLYNEAEKMRSDSEVLRDLAAQQQILRESVGGLYKRLDELGKESPFVAAELNNLIQQAMGNMGFCVDQFSNRRQGQGMNFQREALANLNRAAVRMLDALEKQKQCNKGGASCNKPTMKMNSLCDQQQKLNQQTQSQCQNQGQGNPTAGDAMRKLASEQNAIRKSLADLQNEFGNSREILGRLDAIMEDMKKVADALDEGEVGQETTNRQLQILSRMLDATRTLQRKDFTEQRQAAPGQDIFRNSPPALSGNRVSGGLDIEDRLRRFMDEQYPAEYEQHIKAYFKALLEQTETINVLPDYETE